MVHQELLYHGISQLHADGREAEDDKDGSEIQLQTNPQSLPWRVRGRIDRIGPEQGGQYGDDEDLYPEERFFETSEMFGVGKKDDKAISSRQDQSVMKALPVNEIKAYRQRCDVEEQV